MSAIDDLPPLREVIRRHGLARQEVARPELPARPQSDRPHRARRRPARRRRPWSRSAPVPAGSRARCWRTARGASSRSSATTARSPRLRRSPTRYPGPARRRRRRRAGVRSAPRISTARPARIVANLPYNIATALLVGWLTAEPWPPWYDRLVLMFQREVAERIVAAPGSKRYGRLSVLARLAHARRASCSTSPPSAFVPPPKVTSSLVELIPRAEPLPCDRRRAATGHRSRLRPAPQDAAPEPEIARRDPLSRCSPPPASRRPRAPRTFRSQGFVALARAFGRGAGLSCRHDQALPTVAHRLWCTAMRDRRRGPAAAWHRGARPRAPLRRVPLRPAHAGRLFPAGRRQEARRARRPHPALHARPRDHRRDRARRPDAADALARETGPDLPQLEAGRPVAVYPWIGCGNARPARAAKRTSAPRHAISASRSTAATPVTCCCRIRAT